MRQQYPIILHLAGFALCLLADLPAYSAVWYVDKDNVSGVENGLSWGTAYRTIQPAINAAHADGSGDVWVAEGVYDEARTSIIAVRDVSGTINENSGSVIMYSGVNIYGGFLGNETSLSMRDYTKYRSIVDGIKSRNQSRAYHVVLGANNSILDGLCITNGLSTWSTGGAEGGISTKNGTPLIRNCIFCNNSATSNVSGSSAFRISVDNYILENCIFLNNSTGYGGALGVAISKSVFIRNCSFVCNYGINPDNIANCIFAGVNSSVNIENCIFASNNSFNNGAIYMVSKIVDSIFIGNKSISGNNAVGQFYNASNCVFWGNRAAGHGGAVGLEGIVDCGIEESYYYCVSPKTLSNCTFAKNRAGIAGGAVWANAANIWNCILWDDEPNEIEPWEKSANYVNYSLIEGGVPEGMQSQQLYYDAYCDYDDEVYPTELGILDQDPKFVAGPSGTCTGLVYDAEAVQSVLTDSGASFTPGAWKGAYLGIGTGANEYWYYIIDNDATTLRVWADATEGGTVSAPNAYEVMTHRLAPDSPCIDAGANNTIACYGGVTTDIEGKQRGLDGDGVDNALAGDGSGYDIGAWEYPEAGCGYGLMFEREFAALVKALPDLIGAEAAAQLDADPATLDFENGAAWLAWFKGGSVGLEPALGDGVPDLWQLRLMAETFCVAPEKSGQDAWLDDAAAFRDTYLANREMLNSTIDLILSRYMPPSNRNRLVYVRRETSRVYPALLSISGATRDAYLALLTGLGVTGNYTPITWPGKTVLEPFSGAGDLDRDGRDNATEYDDVISAGGDVDDYIQQAGYNDPFWPNNPAIPIDPWTLAALTLSLAFYARKQLKNP